MKTLLWLDDVRNPHEDDWLVFAPFPQPFEVTWVKDYNQFKYYILTKGLPDGICFDHDLADEHYAPEEFWDDKYNDWAKGQEFQEKTGMDCAKWLVEHCMDNNLTLPKWNSQSANPVGRANINEYLKNYLKSVVLLNK